MKNGFRLAFHVALRWLFALQEYAIGGALYEHVQF